jgi:hypothetical protein
VSVVLEGVQGGGSWWLNDGKHNGAERVTPRAVGAPIIAGGGGWHRWRVLQPGQWRW